MFNERIVNPLEFYTIMIWLFVFFITVLMLSLCYVFLAMRRALERESENREFSALVIDGLEAERRRVSRELHDTVLPLLRNSEASDLIRTICTEMMPPDFDRLSLKDSLANLCVQFTQRTGIECPWVIEEELDFSSIGAEDQLHLYRMVQESFTNIEKHSGANRASLVARRSDHTSPANILVCVSDEGRGLQSKRGIQNMPGLNITAIEKPGLGIKSMRQRAVILGAKLDFISESGNGLMVRIELPNA